MTVLAVFLSFVVVCLNINQTEGFFDQFFQQQHHQNNQQDQQKHDLEAIFMQSKCDKYVCSDTLDCVDSPNDCPCPYPNSQIKCTFPDNEGYVCVSIGERGCDFVEKAFNGLV